MLKPGSVVVLDVDGVLVEPWGFANVLRHEFGITIEQTKDFFSGPFQECLTGESDIRRALPHYLEKWDWKLTIDDFLNLWMTSDNRPNHDVPKLVVQLRTNGLPCRVASNQEAVRAAYLSDEMGFSGLFDDLHFSCDLGSRKPSVEFFGAVHKHLGVGESQVFFWDDEPKNVQIASQFGWRAFLFDGVESIADVT